MPGIRLLLRLVLPISTAAFLYAAPPTFDSAVKPILANTCSACHNDQLASGGLNLKAFQTASSLEDREKWEAILQKLRGGEMPPKGVPRPPQADIDALVNFVQGEYEKADRAVKPDPGRVVSRRLNRNEYTNTVRDLLGVTFRADKDFPTDDSSYGFDNIGEALTVSPVLIEKYLAAAEKIASAAIGADPLPKPITYEGRRSDRTIRRIKSATSETTHRLDVGAEYNVRVLFTGNPPKSETPLVVGFWVDGKLLSSKPLPSAPAGSEITVEDRLYVEAGDHVFRCGIVGDNAPVPAPGPPPMPGEKAPPRPLSPDTISVDGPYPAKVERASRKMILICDPNTGGACVDRILTQFARRAYRRPPTKPEVAALLHFYQLARQQGQNADQGIQLAVEAALVSPEFLFRVEREPVNGGIRRISDTNLASRLSYFLWTSMPDDRLMNLAESGKLHNPEVLDAEVTRMLADPKSSALAENFAGQWLEIRNLDEVHPDPVKFPKWSPDLRDAFRTETNMFFTYILRENRPVSEFIDARYTFVNQMLAEYYGIAGVKGDDFRKVDLTTDQRGGLLSQGTVLTVSSYPTRTSVVLRGKYVLENILGTPPPPPPPDVPQLDNNATGATASLRQQMEAHRSSAVCASCHSKMDPLGFGLENYDGIGAWRTKDGKFPVDSSGTLPNGKSFTTPAELRRLLLADLPGFEHCLAEKLLTYALGRGLGPSDRNTLTDIDHKVTQSDYKFQTLVHEVVRSMPFQMQHGEVISKQIDTTRPKEVASK